MSTSPEWWRSAVVYQVYPRSFQDTTGNGVGDIPGVTARLPYLSDLGVDALWLTPFYPSGGADGGYDVADYCQVDSQLGTLSDFDNLVAAAHATGLRIIVDLVPNHSSHLHSLFQSALGAPPGSPERDAYLFADGTGTDGSNPPNNWRSVFGGSSWTRVTEPDGSPGQWYYHLFAPEQPDFNWESPLVQRYFEDVLRFWLSRGVDGFRIDVSDALIKDTAWPDTADGNPLIPKDSASPVHDIYRRFRQIMDEYPGTTSVLETGADEDTVALFLRPGEMHQAFNFRFLKCPWDASALASAIAESLGATSAVGAPATWVVENHDTARAASRYAGEGGLAGSYVPSSTTAAQGAPDRGLARAKSLAVLALSLPGSAYLYAGQELGLPEVTDLPDETRTDPVFLRSGGAILGRDGCRVPLPWEGAAPPFGFSNAPQTWLPQPPGWASLTAQKQGEDEASTLSFFRRLLRLRRSHPALGTGRLVALTDPASAAESHVVVATLESEAALALGDASGRAAGRTQVVVNLGQCPAPLPQGRVVLATTELEGAQLPADCAAIVNLYAD